MNGRDARRTATSASSRCWTARCWWWRRKWAWRASRGSTLRLLRESSWANIRDRVAIGHFDAAHMLAPMVVAESVGAGHLDTPFMTPMALGSGGNAITVSTRAVAGHAGSTVRGHQRAAGGAGAGAGAGGGATRGGRPAAADAGHGVPVLLPPLPAARLAAVRRRGCGPRRAPGGAAAAAAGGCAAQRPGGWLLRGRALEQPRRGRGHRRDRRGVQRHLAAAAGESTGHARALRGGEPRHRRGAGARAAGRIALGGRCRQPPGPGAAARPAALRGCAGAAAAGGAGWLHPRLAGA